MTEKMTSLIEKIRLDAATFHGETVEPTTINFFFGKNGAGKSTVAGAFSRPECLEWKQGIDPSEVTILVYDRDFIARNLADYGDLKGVFTLSEKNAAIRRAMDEKAARRRAAAAGARQAAGELDRKRGELRSLGAAFEAACWSKSAPLRRAFEGTQGGRKKKLAFAEALVSGEHRPVAHEMAAIEQLYAVAYDPEARPRPLLRLSRELEGDWDLSGARYLGEAVTTRSDTGFARFMEALGATAWVREGHGAFAGHSRDTCPFCQGRIPDTFEQDIAAAFDAGYEAALAGLGAFREAYASRAAALTGLLESNLADVPPQVETAAYEKLLSRLEAVTTGNQARIAGKLADPEEIVELVDTAPLLAEIDARAEAMNGAIGDYNAVAAAREEGRKACRVMVWEAIAFLLREETGAYRKKRGAMEADCRRLEDKVRELEDQCRALAGEIDALGAGVAGTGATVQSINAHLKDSGFQGFHLREKAGVEGTCEVVREDQQVAKNLSEGERNFIAFLYFYHLVREGGGARDKIVVIDDPVSSMDSGALFMVSALVREMIGVCSNSVRLEGSGYDGRYIQQLFILTHNAFFHREVTYNQVGRYRYVSLFKIDKADNVSTIQHCVTRGTAVWEGDRNYNPVQNSYAALWREYERLDSAIPLMNVMRRILEYYFLQLCGYDGGELCARVLAAFREQAGEAASGADYRSFHLAQAMLAYIHRSDSYNEGLAFVDEGIDCGRYRAVFSQIFQVMGQGQHYKLMMDGAG